MRYSNEVFSRTNQRKDYGGRPPGVYTIDHTIVDSSLQGQGIAGKLVQAAVEDIRSQGGEVRATCSYAVKWLQKHEKTIG